MNGQIAKSNCPNPNPNPDPDQVASGYDPLVASRESEYAQLDCILRPRQVRVRVRVRGRVRVRARIRP